MTNPQAGWYPDPSGDTSKIRYWNGTQWTDDYADAQPSAGQTATATATGFEAQQPAADNPGATSAQPTVSSTTYYPQAVPVSGMSDNDRTLRLVAFVFCILGAVAWCWAIIPLAWMVPMTVHAWGIYKGTKDNTTAFGVCTLIFLSLVAGILLLVSKKDR
ncbi:DUF2510 domain-containing protein [Rubneribacter sp.]